MAYNGSPLHVDDGTLYKILCESKKHGVTVFVHAENGEIINSQQKDCLKKGEIAPLFHAVTRQPFVEGEATRRAIYLANSAGAPIYIVHVTCKEGYEAIKQAAINGQKVMGETCTHYLTTSKKVLENPDFIEAAKYICSPALRDEEEQEGLWNALKEGTLNSIVSDHCGIDIEMKKQGLNDFTKIPNGSPGAADRVGVIWTEGVAAGRMTKQEFVQVISTNPAKIAGIYPQKGHIDIGSDADIVIYDPKIHKTIRWSDNPNGVDFNIYEGKEQVGSVDTVLLRGKVVVEGGRFVGKLGQGKFIHSRMYGAAYTGL